uniref:EIN3 n=1 Tax=Solanum tuberosum TaxID=4113 RepID=M1BJ83_SOLTU
MMMFEEIDVEVAEPDDEDIDLDELERRLWRDKMKLKRLKEKMNQDKEDVDSAKRWGKKSRRDKIWRAHDGFRSDRID